MDRKSRFLRAGLLDNRNACLTKEVICQELKGLPVKSISLDNGSEFAEFGALEKELHTLVYFAIFFSKGCDFHAVSPELVARVVDLINNRPKKCLGWRSPIEVFLAECVALA